MPIIWHLLMYSSIEWFFAMWKTGTAFDYIWWKIPSQSSSSLLLLKLLPLSLTGSFLERSFIPKTKLQQKPSSQSWFSPECAAAIIHWNHYNIYHKERCSFALTAFRTACKKSYRKCQVQPHMSSPEKGWKENKNLILWILEDHQSNHQQR